MGFLESIVDGVKSAVEDVSLGLNTMSLSFGHNYPTISLNEAPKGEGIWKDDIGTLMTSKEVEPLVEAVYKAFENDEKITQMLDDVKSGKTKETYEYIDGLITDVKRAHPNNKNRKSYEEGGEVMKILAMVACLNIILPVEYHFVSGLDVRRCVPFIESPEACKCWNEYIKDMPIMDSIKTLLYCNEGCISKFIYGLDLPVVPYFGKVDPEVKEEQEQEAAQKAEKEAEEIKKDVDPSVVLKEKAEPEKINPVVVISNPYKENNEEFETAFPRLKKLGDIVRGGGYNIQYVKPDPENKNPKYSGIFELKVSKDNFIKTLYVDPQVIYGDTYRLITQDRKDDDIVKESYIPFSEKDMILAACTKEGLSADQRKELNSRLPRGMWDVINRVDMSILAKDGINFGTWRSIVTKITKCLGNIPMCRMRLCNIVDKDHFDLVCDAYVQSAFKNKVWATDTHTMAFANGLTVRFDSNIPYGYTVFNTNGTMISFDPYREQHKEEQEKLNNPDQLTVTEVAKGSENVKQPKEAVKEVKEPKAEAVATK